MTVVIRAGRIIDPSRNIDAIGDVVLDGATILETPTADETATFINAEGRWVVPGLIDAHVHLREPGGENKEDLVSGLKAAAAGGFTAVLPMPNTTPPNDSPEITRMMIEKAGTLGGTRLYPVPAATVGRRGEKVGNLPVLFNAGAVAFSDDGTAVGDDRVMAEILKICADLRVPFCQHAEDTRISNGGALHAGPVARQLGVSVWPTAAEYRVVQRDIALARRIQAHVHICHVSTRQTVDLIRRAKEDDVPISAEVTPHHLLLTDEEAPRIGTLAKVNPPLRPKEHVEACIEGLADGTIDIVATDHAPHTMADKGDDFEKAAYGMVGLETAVGLLLELVDRGALTPSRMIEAMTTAPARIFKLQGGTLTPGAVADVTIIDPKRPYTVDPDRFLSKSRNTPYAGRTLPGRAVRTIVNGFTIHKAIR